MFHQAEERFSTPPWCPPWRVAKACNQEERLWFEFFLMTGMREQEVMYTYWSDVVARAETYENMPHDAKYYSLKVPAQSTAPLDVHFSFNEDIYKVFKNPGELGIHYSNL